MRHELTARKHIGKTLLCGYVICAIYPLIVVGYSSLALVPLGVCVATLVLLKKPTSRKALAVSAIISLSCGYAVRKRSYEGTGMTPGAFLGLLLIGAVALGVTFYVFEQERE
ncbi:hypothetical protein LYSHEL_26780 [Lysobacter helvus]|uniref:Uncharacterized protein n=2 Tax=Lysobacteraceae TaxID=32033 RepID=A0ABM7Q894_9GAMM|nr:MULTISPECIES: hypothetical protein [Lysobacter]BCT93652.1 hypothetical protein LYSCAS_26760 [Lysobacter caseinilyticus]BCT96807.1 hypothetical protein LYSHEL_26780 [Lysobacter helvus]